jgi:hypothetical protein
MSRDQETSFEMGVPSREGRYTLKVRGIDRSGRIQESGSLAGSLFGTYPDGARGIHSVHVVVP